MNFKSAIAGLMVAGTLFCVEVPALAKAPANPAATVAAKVTTVNINSANAKQLSNALEDVGPAKAQAIIDYRKSHGPFKAVQDLSHVRGIGPKTLAENRERIQLN